MNIFLHGLDLYLVFFFIFLLGIPNTQDGFENVFGLPENS